MSFFGGLGRLFGFSKSKDQGDYQGYRAPALSDTEWGRRVWGGTGGITDAMERKGTGYTPDIFEVDRAAWADVGRDMLRDQLAAQDVRSSARGLGRSSVAAAQNLQARADLSHKLAMRAADLRRQSQQEEIRQQMQGRQIGLAGAEADVRSRQFQEAQERAEFARQQGFRERQDQAQQQGLLRSIMAPIGFLGGGMQPEGWDWGAAIRGATGQDTSNFLDLIRDERNRRTAGQVKRGGQEYAYGPTSNTFA